MALYSLVYTSIAVKVHGDDDLEDILTVSRRNNQPRGVTGMLLFKDGHFIQALEGEKDVVLPLYDKISADPRHCNIYQVSGRVVAERTFGDWTMGYHRLDSVAPDELPGFTDFLQRPFDPQFLLENPSRAIYLLEFFKNRRVF